jgi:acylphosphatase
MAVKANVYVYGSVLAVGYRVYVKNVAVMMGVRGLVRNLGDGSVEIFVEAEKKDVLEKFIKAVDVKGRPGDVLSLNVERVEVRWEGEPGYIGPWRRYTQFEIDYGEEITRPVEREMVESLELAKLYFTKLISEFKDFREEFRDYRQEFRDFRDESLKISREILDISKEVLGEVKGLRKDLQTILDERLVRMERDIAEIKAKIGLI